MTTRPHYQDETVTLLHGNAVDMLATMPDQSVGCIVTSPPYYGLRDYGEGGQLGAEATPAEFVTNLVDVFHEARRVLADDGTFWLNLGDSYVGNASSGGKSKTLDGASQQVSSGKLPTKGDGGLPPKNLMGIPWRVAFALQDDGWILRNSIIWHKPNAMPESVTDRLSGRHENLFMLSKSRHYWFDLDPIREQPSEYVGHSWSDRKNAGEPIRRGMKPRKGELTMFAANPAGKNPGDVWTIPTQGFPDAHFAVFPLALAERCVLAGAKPGTAVLDPFSGSGTTGMAAAKHGRRYIGIDLNAEYLDLSLRTRLVQPGLDLEGIA